MSDSQKQKVTEAISREAKLLGGERTEFTGTGRFRRTTFRTTFRRTTCRTTGRRTRRCHKRIPLIISISVEVRKFKRRRRTTSFRRTTRRTTFRRTSFRRSRTRS